MPKNWEWLECAIWTVVLVHNLYDLWANWIQREQVNAELILDFSQPFNRVNYRVSAVLLGLFVLRLGVEVPRLPNIILVAAMAAMCVRMFFEVIPTPGIHRDSLVISSHPKRVPRRVKWSDIRSYQWKPTHTLIINPGWFQVQGEIPDEFVAEVEETLRVKVIQ